MNRSTKIVVIGMVILILSYIIIGLYKQNSTVSGDAKLNQGQNKNEYTYYLTSGDNEVILASNSETEKTTIKYLFNDKNGNLYKINILEECQSSGDAQKYYEGIKESNSMSQVYSDITIEDNIVIMTLKQEYVDYHKEFSKEDIYAMQQEMIEKKLKKQQ